MKLNKILVILVLLVTVIFSWHFEFSGKEAEIDYQKIYKEEANQFINKKLYYDGYLIYKDKIISDYPTEDNYQVYIDLLLKLGKNIEAEKISLEAIEKYPNSLDIYKKLLDLYFESRSHKLNDFVFKMKKKFNDFEDVRISNLFLEFEERNIMVNDLYQFNDEYAVIREGNLYGVVDRGLSSRMESKYEKIGSYSPETKLFPVKYQGEVYYMDIDGYKRKHNEDNFDVLGTQRENKAYAGKDNKYGYINYDMEKLTAIEYDDATTFKNGIAFVKKENKWSMINSNFEIVKDKAYDEIAFDDNKIANQHGVFFARVGEKWNLFDEKGNILSEKSFLDIKKFESNEAAAVKLEQGWTFIDKNGKLLDYIFEDAYSYRFGKTIVKKDGKWYMIDKKFTIGKELPYKSASSFNDIGYAKVVTIEDKVTFISTYIEKEE